MNKTKCPICNKLISKRQRALSILEIAKGSGVRRSYHEECWEKENDGIL